MLSSTLDMKTIGVYELQNLRKYIGRITSLGMLSDAKNLSKKEAKKRVHIEMQSKNYDSVYEKDLYTAPSTQENLFTPGTIETDWANSLKIVEDYNGKDLTMDEAKFYISFTNVLKIKDMLEDYAAKVDQQGGLVLDLSKNDKFDLVAKIIAINYNINTANYYNKDINEKQKCLYQNKADDMKKIWNKRCFEEIINRFEEKVNHIEVYDIEHQFGLLYTEILKQVDIVNKTGIESRGINQNPKLSIDTREAVVDEIKKDLANGIINYDPIRYSGTILSSFEKCNSDVSLVLGDNDTGFYHMLLRHVNISNVQVIDDYRKNAPKTSLFPEGMEIEEIIGLMGYAIDKGDIKISTDKEGNPIVAEVNAEIDTAANLEYGIKEDCGLSKIRVIIADPKIDETGSKIIGGLVITAYPIEGSKVKIMKYGVIDEQ